MDPISRNLELAPANTAATVQERLDAKKAQAQLNKTNGGPISQWMSHYDPVIDLYGTGTGSPLTFYRSYLCRFYSGSRFWHPCWC